MRQLLGVAQWGALLCALLLAARSGAGTVVALGGGALIALAAAGIEAPAPGRRHRVVAAISIGGPAVIVAVTGGWASPLLPCVIPPVLAVGLLFGFTSAVATALLTVVAVSRLEPGVEVVAWTLELTLLALVGAHARRLEGDRSPLDHLRAANELLVELGSLSHSVAVTTDVDEVVRRAADTTRELLGADRVELSAELDGVAGATSGECDEPAHHRSVPLTVAGVEIGELVVSRCLPLDRTEEALLTSVATQAALAIDNARRLQRIRSLAVSEERRRIARDLHDQFGQELSGLGYLLDTAAAAPPEQAAAALATARSSVARVVVQLREAITDLRAQVDPDVGLAGSLEAFLERVGGRSGLRTSLEADRAPSLPPTVERELLHIAQEAVVNAERHARASHVGVRLSANGREAVLRVVDDGAGIADPDRAGHYGLVGMRERARSLGADFVIDSDPTIGTTVECRLPL